MDEKIDKQEIVIPQGSSPADMIRLAVSGGADLEKLEKLLMLQERYEANEAKRIFTAAFALAQEKVTLVIKTKLNPQTHSKYATLEDIIESVKPIYTKEGFSVIFYEGDTVSPDAIRICADVLHKRGHKETYHYDVPLDGKGIKGNANMTAIHAKASSVSYGRRYLMCMIWNIPTGDDNDGNGAENVRPIEYISDAEQHQIADLLINKNIKEGKLLGYLKVKSLAEIPKTRLAQVITMINAKKEKEVIER